MALEGGTRTSLSTQVTATFQPAWGMYSPGLPPEPVMGNMPVRAYDYPSGVNYQYTPRAYEPFGFPALRSFANVELVRLAIETRKDQVERLNWQVKLKDNTQRARVSDSDTRIRKITKMLKKPDGVTPFATWMRMLIEDLLVLDAPTIEKRRNVAGDVVALDVVDGSTIKLLVDEAGRRPPLPAPCFQQVIKGVIWSDLTPEDIIYMPRNLRPGHVYGYGPVEQIVVTINTLLARQTQQLAYFSDSNIPQGIINTPDGWQPDQVRDYQNWMDARLGGNIRERSKLLWTPFGSKYQSFKDSPIKDEFDEWLARVVCFAFSLPPTPFVKMMNRATAQDADERALEEGRAPLLLWAKRVIDDVIQIDMGHDDLEFAWDIPQEVDPEKQAKVHDAYLKNGTLTIDEVRSDMGLSTVPGGNRNLIYTPSGVIEVNNAGTMEEPINQIKMAALEAKSKAADDAEDSSAEDAPSDENVSEDA